MKKIILISCHCDNGEKLDVLKNNILKLKGKGLEIALISHLQIPQDVTSLVDFTFITKENPIFSYPVKCIMYWRGFIYNEKVLKVFNAIPDYGYAGLNHIKRLGEMFIKYDYDHFDFIIYDTTLTDYVIDVLCNNTESLVHPFFRGDFKKSTTGLHLISLTKKDLANILPRITEENYLQDLDWTAEDFMYEYLIKPENIKISPVGVTDQILFIEGDPVNHSKITGLNYSIILPYKSDENIKIFFYEGNNQRISILVNENEIKTIIEKELLLDLGINIKNLGEVSFYFHGNRYYIADQIRKHNHSHIIIE